jgi:hypothetical protein
MNALLAGQFDSSHDDDLLRELDELDSEPSRLILPLPPTRALVDPAPIVLPEVPSHAIAIKVERAALSS